MNITERLRDTKRLFYTYRNGIIADKLRETDVKHKIIFGLNINQLSAIAIQLGEDQELADTLWKNSSTRESQLLAPMIFPESNFTQEIAQYWIETTPNTEVADILCFKLLRKMPYANGIAHRNCKSTDSMIRYTAMRLWLNLMIINKLTNEEINNLYHKAKEEINNDFPPIKSVALQIISEIDFLRQ